MVIGNPPYRNNSNRTLAQVAVTFPRLLASSRANARARTRNIRDDYAWFFAAADFYITSRGMIAYVVSDSFCRSISYRWFREDLLRYYEIQNLVHLGTFVFRDVGPRTSFVIVVLERRPAALARADDTGPLQYIDLRPLVEGHPDAEGTPDDPRLLRLAEIAADPGPLMLPPGLAHTPTREHAFALFPAGELVAKVDGCGIPLHAKSGSRIFLRKWPGIITAFDALFKADHQEELATRMRVFFDNCTASSTGQLEQRLTEFATQLGMGDDETGRLNHLAQTARLRNYVYDDSRVRRAISGSAPNESCWYPHSDSLCWIYYEPRLAAPRNVHEGRNPGWGTMSQWRDPSSHHIQPKLIYTTARHADRGLKAFVVEEPILCKLHGGTRQQFHYTGLFDPTRDARLDGVPNNLGEEALLLYRYFLDHGCEADSILFYVAGIYNSQVAEDYLRQGGRDVLSIPVIPDAMPMDRVLEIVFLGRSLRNLAWLQAVLQDANEIDAEWIRTRFDAPAIQMLALKEASTGGGRFRRRTSFRPAEETAAAIGERVGELNAALDIAVERLYGL